MKIKIFHYRKGTGKILNKTMSQSLLMSYFHQKIVKSENNFNRENNALLLTINDDDDDDDDEKYYFDVKSKLELYSSEWLRSKK